MALSVFVCVCPMLYVDTHTHIWKMRQTPLFSLKALWMDVVRLDCFYGNCSSFTPHSPFECVIVRVFMYTKTLCFRSCTSTTIRVSHHECSLYTLYLGIYIYPLVCVCVCVLVVVKRPLWYKPLKPKEKNALVSGKHAQMQFECFTVSCKFRSFCLSINCKCSKTL